MNNHRNPRGKSTVPELLAPAGNVSSAMAAFEYGADAVYAGLKKFNARERTENFSLEEMHRVVRYAHANGKKVYVTFNTLIKESEIREAAEILAELAFIRPDALIIQDLGVLNIVKNHFPELAVHASTQMAIHNSAGVKAAEGLGIRRVILERQITLPELEEITRKSPVEIEVFVHGAICCSFSGECILSSWMGGCSGNRGKCKQPCRHEYFTCADSASRQGFFFSTKDLCMIRHVPFLKEIGVSALKIEGRLRKPDYVKNIVSAYRLVLDSSRSNEKAAVKDAEELIEMSYGRNFIHGFTGASSFSEVLLPGESGVSGELCGSISGTRNDGFFVKLTRRLHVGDRIRVQMPSGIKASSMTVSNMSVNGAKAMHASAGQICFISTPREVVPNGTVYKIGEDIGDLSSRVKNISLTTPAELDLTVDIDRHGFKIAAIYNSNRFSWIKEIDIAEAEKLPLSEEKITDEFSSTANEIFKTGKIEARINGNLFIPLSVLKKIRREFWDWIASNVKPGDPKAGVIGRLQNFVDDFEKLKIIKDEKVYGKTFLYENIFPKSKSLADGEIIALPVKSCKDIASDRKNIFTATIPAFCPEYGLASTARDIREAYAAGIRRFRVSSLYGLELLREYKDIHVATSYPLPVCNSLAVCEIRRMGVSQVQAWPELEECELRSLVAKSPLPAEIYRFGRIPLMITRAQVPVEGMIRDFRNNRFLVKKDDAAGVFYVFSEKVLSLPQIEGCLDFFDLSNADLSEKEASSFNFFGQLA